MRKNSTILSKKVERDAQNRRKLFSDLQLQIFTGFQVSAANSVGVIDEKVGMRKQISENDSSFSANAETQSTQYAGPVTLQKSGRKHRRCSSLSRNKCDRQGHELPIPSGETICQPQNRADCRLQIRFAPLLCSWEAREVGESTLRCTYIGSITNVLSIQLPPL